MTANEIRNDDSRDEWLYLREIAAQLAELNQHLREQAAKGEQAISTALADFKKSLETL